MGLLLRIKAKIKYMMFQYRLSNTVKIKGKAYIENQNIVFGENVTIYPGVHIWGNGKIVVGNNVALGKDTIIFSSSEIIIGNDTAIAAQSYIIDCDHSIDRSRLIRKQPLISIPIKIGNDVWIGAGAKILKGSIIEDGAVIGALGLVNGKTIQAYSINVGIPVRKIGERH